MWVNIPHTGYVGVAVVEDSAVMAKNFTVHTEEGEKPIFEVPLKASFLKQFIDDEEKAEAKIDSEAHDSTPNKSKGE